ncbi:hypothetical protein LCGC14_1317050 [marine sediment metagenome]|uniref:Uncharacterized protein n=1 Tax=marine sediment metagenome TaxID=412755 RepID=A0A0F9KL49_9ZZZZ
MYRGMTKNGKEVKGYYCKVQNKHYIILGNAKVYSIVGIDSVSGNEFLEGFIEVDPESISQFVGIKDENNQDIYGSIPIDGKMSRGGDRIKLSCGGYIYTIEYQANKNVWDYKIEVIGNQMEEE